MYFKIGIGLGFSKGFYKGKLPKRNPPRCMYQYTYIYI